MEMLLFTCRWVAYHNSIRDPCSYFNHTCIVLVGLSHCMVILLQNSQLANSILRGPSCMRRWQQNLTRRDLHFLGMARLRSPWRYTSSHLYMIRMCALRKNSLDTIICEQAMTYVWVAHLLRICGENLNAFVLCSCQISLKWRKGK